MTKRPTRQTKMLQSLLVEVCGKEAKSVLRAAVRWYRHYEGFIRDERRAMHARVSLSKAVASYERAKKRSKP